VIKYTRPSSPNGRQLNFFPPGRELPRLQPRPRRSFLRGQRADALWIGCGCLWRGGL